MAIKFIDIPIVQYPRPAFIVGAFSGTSNFAINAVNERVHFVGQLQLENPAGGSKTISSAGGLIGWKSGITTFVNASTNLRVGLQDLHATDNPAHGDHTFDVYADLVGGTDTITSNAWQENAMETGTKTLDHGDFLAIAFELTSYGGSDSVTVEVATAQFGDDSTPIFNTPWFDDGTPAVANYHAGAVIVFDDASLGWVNNTSVGEEAVETFHVDTAGADEYGMVITPSADLRVCGVYIKGAVTVSTGNFDIVVYEDPFGTPSTLHTESLDATFAQNSSRQLDVLFSTEQVLRAGKTYAITMKPTTTNTVSLNYIDSWAADGDYFREVYGVLQDDIYACKRLNGSGAFSANEVSTGNKDRLACISLLVNGIRSTQGGTVQQIGI